MLRIKESAHLRVVETINGVSAGIVEAMLPDQIDH